MFKKKCKKCDEHVSKKFEFCPFCGTPTSYKKQKKEDYGMLGRDDEISEVDEIGQLLGGVGGGFLNKMLGSAVKMFEKELQKEMQRGMQGEIRNQNRVPSKKQSNSPINSNFQLYINGKKVNIGPEQQVKKVNQKLKKVEEKKSELPMPSEKTILESRHLPRKETTTKLKRLSNKIIYEVDAPGAKSLDKILLNRTEEGIELRIFTKDKVLTKNIAINLPLIEYYLKKQKLFLEFSEDN